MQILVDYYIVQVVGEVLLRFKISARVDRSLGSILHSLSPVLTVLSSIGQLV